MWKLTWFLRDLPTAPERLSPSEVDERALRGLVGVVKIKHTVVNGIPTFRTAASSSLSL
jgi:hypothetical protein